MKARKTLLGPRSEKQHKVMLGRFWEISTKDKTEVRGLMASERSLDKRTKKTRAIEGGEMRGRNMWN